MAEEKVEQDGQAYDIRDSRYLFVEVAAQRCAQLMRGAKPKIDVRAHKFTTLATEEVGEGLVPWEMVSEEEAAAEADDLEGAEGAE